MARQRPNPSRFFGLALGRYDNFNARTDGLIGLGDTTPSVALYSLLWANTCGSLAISYFDDASEGQLVILGNLSNGSVNFGGANLNQQTSSPLLMGEFAAFIHHNSTWTEMFRSDQNVADEAVTVLPVSATDPLWKGTSAGNFDVTGLSFVDINSNGGATMRGLSGGVVGQTLTIFVGGGGGLTLTGCSGGGAGTFVSASCQNLVMIASQSVTITKNIDNLWVIEGSLLSQI